MSETHENPPGYRVIFHGAGIVNRDPCAWGFLWTGPGIPETFGGPWDTKEKAYAEAWKHYKRRLREAKSRARDMIAHAVAKLLDRGVPQGHITFFLSKEDYRIVRDQLSDDLRGDWPEPDSIEPGPYSLGMMHGANVFLSGFDTSKAVGLNWRHYMVKPELTETICLARASMT